ncbi:type III secretion protein HrpD [Erwinia phyllosphaerae]|uniref:type III secretion protein HrpD n=1 Tax=Erwinia phyllosphaerae TaxID=2853256 RepID=UPI001FF00EF2|nr:type III secretion protein HrpD [Erwinia phyllosphaerae]MBV4368608.1 type III secretion protein HrpD [Erwinia phyllosphaerae]
MTQEQALDWLHWWQQGWWQQAHGSWQSAFFSLPPDSQQMLAWQHPQAVAAGFAVPYTLPPEPEARILALASFSDDRWQRLLALLAACCAPQLTLPQLTAADLIWCRRLAKALRCESWLSAACFQPWTTGGLLLLRCLHPQSWPRLRLRFPPEWVKQLEEYPLLTLPPSRLAALYDAAIWQSQQSEKMPYVD